TAGGLLSVEEALARVLSLVRPLEAERASIEDAVGRVLREDVTAIADVPPADNSAMDGYAVRSADAARAPVTLRVIGEVAAGRVPSQTVEEGTAMRIMTGAAIPPGADAVAQVEITDGGTERVTIDRNVTAGTNVRRRGEDMRAGEVVLRAGTRIGAAEIAVAAAARRQALMAGRRPALAILATGDELVPLASGEGVVDSNSYALASLAREAGAIPRRAALVRDTLEATREAIEGALDADFIVTTGGVSVGAYDFVKEALDALGARTHLWRVAMKPGKPVVVATLRGRLFFGLPGNPVSAMVSFLLFVAPAIRKALGETSLTAPVVRIRTTGALKGAGDRRAYLRVRVVAREGELLAEPMRAQGSHIATSMVQANGLAIVDAAVVEAGELVPVMMIGPIGAG
ncbi:MAG TPA: gephyrin-like molybdotransferase Glp, partial [Thermoanaerobaculia bacterium]|nr:gephyrin-like molybdotransferase Glp [Thermoanaerobaculia bacterium]